MANVAINAVEALLMDSIYDYLSCDPQALYPVNPELAAKFFSKEQMMNLEEKLKFIEGDLLNLIFYIDDSPLTQDNIYLDITSRIKVTKDGESYKFYLISENQELRIFDVINEQNSNYFNFKLELSRFFSKEKTISPQKIIKPSKTA